MIIFWSCQFELMINFLIMSFNLKDKIHCVLYLCCTGLGNNFWNRGIVGKFPHTRKGVARDSEVINHDQKEPRADTGTNYRANGSSCDREKYLSLYLGRIAFPPSDWFIRHLYGQILSKWFGSGEAVLITCACCWLTPNTRTHEYRLRIFTPPT